MHSRVTDARAHDVPVLCLQRHSVKSVLTGHIPLYGRRIRESATTTQCKCCQAATAADGVGRSPGGAGLRDAGLGKRTLLAEEHREQGQREA